MTKFGSSFMMKSPLYEHGEKLRKEAMRLSKESSGRDDSPDYDNPEVVKLLDQAKKANKSHGSDSPVKGYVSDAQRKAVHASKADGGKGAPTKMKSPLHAPVTATQEITSDMYYQPRDEMDYSKMSEAAKALGKSINTAVTGGMGGKKKTDAIDDHGDKARKKISDLKTKNQNAKTLQDNSQMKWVSGQDGKPGQFMRVDKNNNFYSVKPGDNYGKKVASISGKDDVYKIQKDKENKAVFDLNKTIDISKNF
jgi:hypothetical protein